MRNLEAIQEPLLLAAENYKGMLCAEIKNKRDEFLN